jgi:hypothetical protein
MSHKNGAHIFPLEQGKIRQGIRFPIDAHPGIDDKPLLGKLNGKATRANTTRPT